MSLEAWHQVHDDYVLEHGEDSRPEAVVHADGEEPWEFRMEPGGKWLVEEANYIQVYHAAHGALFSGAAREEMEEVNSQLGGGP